jgi:DNA-binding beta-propeller fold protein YncE
MSYKVITDPGGALLQDISSLTYTNYDVNYIPNYNKTYQLRNSVGKVVADNFYPFTCPTSFITPHPYLARDASNNVYVTKQTISLIGGLNTVAKIVNNVLVDLNFTLSPFTTAQFIQGIAFDSSGILYITTSGDQASGFSRITKVQIDPVKSIQTSFEISNMDLNNTDLRGLDFDSSGNLYIADNANSNIIKIVMTSYSTGVGSIYVPNYAGLNAPLDIKFDQYDNGYIANSNEGNIIKVTSSGAISVFATGLLCPTELTFNFADSALYSTNYGYSQPDQPNTYLAKIVNGVVTNIKYVSFPYGIVATTTGEIYYTSSDFYNSTQNGSDGTNKIYQLIPDNTTSNYANIITTIGPDESIRPITYTAFDAFQNLYAAQYTNDVSYNGVIWKISNVSPYDPVSFYPASGLDPPLYNPTALAFNSAKTYLYVANSTSNEIIAINMSGPSGTIVTITGTALSSPSAIVFDGTGGFGKLYVANSVNNTICILTFTSAIAATSALYVFTGSPLSSPAGLDFDSTYDNLYVSNAGYNNVLKISVSTNVASIYNLNGVSINSPTGILFDDSSSILYVSDIDTNQIIQITNNNTATNLSIIAGDSIRVPPVPITLNQPMGLTLDICGNFYISNYANYYDAVVKLTFDYSVNLINTTGLFFPTDTAIGISNNDIFVCNLFSNVISKLDTNNVLTDYATTTGCTSDNLSITINNGSGRLYVLDVSGNVCSIDSNLNVNTFTITGTTPSAGAGCIRYRSPKLLYIADSPNNRIIKVDITNPANAGTGTALAITGISAGFNPTRIAFDSIGNMYISTSFTLGGTLNDYNIVYKVNLSTLVATTYITLPDIEPTLGIPGIAFDAEDYMYTIAVQNFTILYQLYRTTPDGSTTELVPQNFTAGIAFQSLNYIPWENALVMSDRDGNRLYKVYLSYLFFNMLGKLGLYDDTLFIFEYFPNAEGIGFTFDVSFNVYTPYVVIDPANIPADIPTNVSFHFVIPYVIPAPTDSYRLTCNGTIVSDVFCNNCTYNKTKFLAGTYPTGLVYSTDTTYLYVALQNNTISRINILGAVENNYIPAEFGLVGPTSLVLDASFDMFILNAGSDFISYLTLRNNIISINNSFFTGIFVPICLTYDADTDSLYLLSGAVPNTRITRINARTGEGVVLPLAFGSLYDPNGLTIDAYGGLVGSVSYVYSSNTKYLYVSNTDQYNNNEIKRINITEGSSLLYEVSTLVSGLTYKPFTMANQNDGYLYVANKTSNNISKISLTGLDPNIQPWAVNGISVPVDLCFDNLGDLFVANSGTNPRNSRVSKIYTNYFFFTNVILADGTCSNAQIYDITTQSCVEVDYYPAPSNPCSFPIPIPFPIGS